MLIDSGTVCNCQMPVKYCIDQYMRIYTHLFIGIFTIQFVLVPKTLFASTKLLDNRELNRKPEFPNEHDNHFDA